MTEKSLENNAMQETTPEERLYAIKFVISPVLSQKDIKIRRNGFKRDKKVVGLKICIVNIFVRGQFSFSPLNSMYEFSCNTRARNLWLIANTFQLHYIMFRRKSKGFIWI